MGHYGLSWGESITKCGCVWNGSWFARNVGYFRRAFKPRYAFEKHQMHVARWAVALFGDKKIHRDRLA